MERGVTRGGGGGGGHPYRAPRVRGRGVTTWIVTSLAATISDNDATTRRLIHAASAASPPSPLGHRCTARARMICAFEAGSGPALIGGVVGGVDAKVRRAPQEGAGMPPRSCGWCSRDPISSECNCGARHCCTNTEVEREKRSRSASASSAELYCGSVIADSDCNDSARP